jgi:hypothetical protein
MASHLMPILYDALSRPLHTEPRLVAELESQRDATSNSVAFSCAAWIALRSKDEVLVIESMEGRRIGYPQIITCICDELGYNYRLEP